MATLVFLSVFTLVWQLFILFACCSGLGLFWRFLLPKDFSPLNKMLFSLLGGFFLVVLVPENLVYLGMPVRISAWLLLTAALVPVWFCRRNFVAQIRTYGADIDIRTLAMVIFLSIAFHAAVPVQQGLEWYYGKGHFDQINYVLLAEFLKQEPYSTSQQEIGLRPWLVRPVGFKDDAGRMGTEPGTAQEMTGLKKVRIGQSIITAEISVWSGTNAKAGYAATVIFFLTLLSICLYVFLREIGLDRFLAVSGALLAALLPAVTRLSLDGFLSQVSILFVFYFFAILLRRQDLSARGFTLFFSLTLAYLVAAYSEIAPLGFCTLVLGVIVVRQDNLRTKRLMLMSAMLLIAVTNLYYLRNLIEFLGQQYYFASHDASLDNLAPNVFTVLGWSELIFGSVNSTPLTLFFDGCVIAFGLMVLAGVIFLSRRDKLIFVAILLPAIFAVLYLATRTSHFYYPVAKITLSVLPFIMSLVLVGLSKAGATVQGDRLGMLKKLLAAVIITAAAAGSVRYYSEVLKNGDLLRFVREPHFQKVCRELEKIKNKRILIFEAHQLLTPWLCYHARHNDVYFDGRFISDSPVPQLFSFSRIPSLENVDLVVTRDQIIDLKIPGVACLTLVDDIPGEDRTNGRVHYWLGPPAGLRFLAVRPISANLEMRLAPGPEATTLPIDYFLADEQGHVMQGEIRGKNVEVQRIDIQRGLSTLELSVKAKGDALNAPPSYPILAELDGIELDDIDGSPGG